MHQSPLRPHFVKATVKVHRYPDGRLAVFHGRRCLGRYACDGTPAVEPAAVAGNLPVGSRTAAKVASRTATVNRDRGASHDATPPTPPGIRVRTTAVRRIKRPPAYP
jgi:hypothetical protein